MTPVVHFEYLVQIRRLEIQIIQHLSKLSHCRITFIHFTPPVSLWMSSSPDLKYGFFQLKVPISSQVTNNQVINHTLT